MYYELALISILIAASYWGFYFIRLAPQTRTYGMMQLGAALLAGLGLYHRRVGGPDWWGIAGAIGVGTGACVLVLGPLVRAAARRFAGAERFKIAETLLDIADVLAPGSGVAEEKQLLSAMREIRDGNIEQTVAALTAARDQAPDEARRAIDERIAMLYLAAYRWDDAIAYAETNLFGALPIAERIVTKLPDGNIITTTSRPNTLRHALGIAPSVWVELLGAYGYKGDLERAAAMLAKLEDVCAGREEAAIWVHRGRMIFLALAGRVAAVETLLEPRVARHMSRGARSYWLAVAHERGGDPRNAEAAYAKARTRSRGRPRVLIDQALERLSAAQGMKISLLPVATELVARVEAAPTPVVVARDQVKRPWATRGLTAAMFVTAATITICVGDSSDLGVLVRSGAMVRGFIHDGEWWRIISCNFIHVGGLHLLVNTLGLWFLGKLCEEMFGAVRTLAIFAIAGVGGFVASFLASPVGVSAGASGAIFGLLGAIFVELTLHKQHYRAAWSRGMWGSIVVVALGQFALDVFMYAGITDQYAHLGGAAFGALAGTVFSPHVKLYRHATKLAYLVVAAFATASLFAIVMIVRTPIAKSLGTPDHVFAIGPAELAKAPASWSFDETLHDPDDIIEVRFETSNADKPFDGFAAKEQARIRKRYERIDIATTHVVPEVAGWTTEELAVSAEEPDAVGGQEKYLLLVAAKPARGGTLLVSIEVAETIARAAPAFFAALLQSVDVR